MLRFAAGSGVLAMTEADYAHPDVGPLMDQWLVGPNIDARRRLELVKLAWDMTGTEFGSPRRPLRAALLRRSRDQRPALVRQPRHEGVRGAGAAVAADLARRLDGARSAERRDLHDPPETRKRSLHCASLRSASVETTGGARGGGLGNLGNLANPPIARD